MATREVIALTGGIGSGKSTVALLFKEKGARIIDADTLARDVVAPGQPALDEIRNTFGSEVISCDGSLDRRRLADIIFANPQDRLKLENILHPRIRNAFVEALASPTDGAPPFTLYVVPLFFESSNPYPEIQKVIVVWAPEDVCVERIMKRDSLSYEQAIQRARSQLPIDQKASRANWVIRNDGHEESLKSQVEKVFSDIINL